MNLKAKNRLIITKSVQIDRELRSCGYAKFELIAEGSFGKVYRGGFAFNERIGKTLAIKVVDTTGDREMTEKFLPREIEHLKRVRHRHFIEIVDLIEMPRSSRVYIVMRFASGGSLSELLVKNGPMSDAFARRVFSQLCDVIRYLHSINISHRDLKTDNVLFDENSDVKLIDLGLSKSCKPVNGHQRLSGCDTFCGSLGFVAPEILQNSRYCAKTADIWSLGCILFSIVTCQIPFCQSNVNLMVDNQMKRCVEKISQSLLNVIDSDLVQILYRILDPEPTTRASLREITNSTWMLKTSTVPECPLKKLLPKDAKLSLVGVRMFETMTKAEQ